MDAALTQASAREPGTTIRLDSLAAFAWDTVWVLGPYSLPLDSDTAHPAIRAAAGTSIERQDHSNVLVFMDGADAKAVVDHLRADGGFAIASGRRAFARREAVFTVCRHRRNVWPVLVPAGVRDTTVSCTKSTVNDSLD